VTAQRQHRAATAEIAQATQDYAALTASRPMSAAPSAINGAVSRIDELLAERESEAEALAQKLEAARRLRDERDRLIKRYNTAREAMDRRQNERQSATTRQQKFVERAAQLAATLAHNGERIASIDRSLTPFLDLCGLMTADLDRDPVSARARLVQASENHQKAQAILDRLTQICGTLELRAATLTAEAQAAADSFATLSQTYAAQCKTLKDLRAERARLLDGEATKDHRARHEEQRKALVDAFEQKRSLRAIAGESAAAARSLAEESLREIETTTQALRMAQDAFLQACAAVGLTQVAAEGLLTAPQEEIFSLRELLRLAQERCAAARATIAARRQDVDVSRADLPEAQQEDLAARAAVLLEQLEAMSSRMGVLREQITQDDTARQRAAGLSREIDAARATNKLWDEINAAIGSRSGDKFRRFAQSVTLDQLVALANQRLALLSPRYRLEKSGEIDSLGLQIVDRDLGDERRSTRSLSGGERFLASLALALALAGLEGRDSFVDTLFIDEGFGSLDSMTLDIAIDALESLQGQGRKVGVISHVDSLQQRISTKISVERRGGGLSVVRVCAPGWAAEA
jgi:exonuclease SbcC